MYDTGSTTFMLICTMLVFLMTPGLAFFYGGLSRRKNVINTMLMCFGAIGLVGVLWIVAGWSLAYGGDGSSPFIGGLDQLLCLPVLNQVLQAAEGNAADGAVYPQVINIAFQMAFAMITAAIVTGSLAGRVKFGAMTAFLGIWLLVVYAPLAHMVWGGEGSFIGDIIGALDFAGGDVVHISSGLTGLILCLMLGRRRGFGMVSYRPHNVPFVALGAGLLWFGWFGFNGGSTVCATGDDVLTSMGRIFVTTNMAAASAATATMFLTWLRYGKPDVSMTLNGALAGLVAITAGCDAVSVPGAFVIGIIAGLVIVFAVEFFDQIARIDDPVGAISVHGVCGALGTLLVGVFAVDGGLLYGGGSELLIIQATGVAAVAAYIGIVMTLIFQILDKTIGLRVSTREEIAGLDMEEHGLASSYADFMPAAEDFHGAVTAQEAAEAGAAVTHVTAALPSAGRPKMTKIVIITSQLRFEILKEALDKLGITGMTVTKVLGYGLQKGNTEYYRGAEVSVHLLPKVKVELVVSAIPVAAVVAAAKKVLYTGKYGDGKIFIYDVENVVKIRTGEEGYEALQDEPIEA